MPDSDHPQTVSLPPDAGSTLAFRPDAEAFDETNSAPKPVSLPGYEILEELGRGGMGVVYLARQVRLNRAVALKMILSGGHASAKDLLRFLSEAEAAAAVSHAGIVQVFESGHHDGLPYLALEYCPGGTLAKKLDGTPLPPREAARLVEQLAGAVHAAHDKGIVHRDLKPANVLFAQDGTPKVSDFGLARRGDSGDGLTVTGAIMGTPSYMAPEQARGAKEIGPGTDVYSLGAILYECLTGRPPFRAATPMETVMQVQNEEPVPPSRLVPKLPRDLETICLKCLAKEAHRRYASAAALAEDLCAFFDGHAIRARPVSSLERGWKAAKRRPAVTGLVLAIIACIGLAAAALYYESEKRYRLARESGERIFNANIALEAERKDALAAKKDADVQRAKAQDRLEKAVEAVDKMMLRVAGERWARKPELREERKIVLQDAVAFFQGLSEEDSRDPRVRRETVNANMRVAGAHMSLGDTPAAIRHLTKAVELQRAILAETPDHPPELGQLAILLNMLASAELLMANYAPAETLYKEAIETARRGVALSKEGKSAGGTPTPAPSEPVGPPVADALRPTSARVVLVDCLSSYAHYVSNREPEHSAKMFEETLSIARSLRKGGDKSYSVRLALALSLANRFTIELNRNQSAEAVKNLTEAEGLVAELVRDDPPTARMADLRDSTRMQVLGGRGLLLSRSRKPLQAVEKFKESLAIVEGMLAFQPGYFPWMYQRLLILIQIAEAYHNAGQPDDAKTTLTTIDAAEKELLAAYPQHTWIPGQSAVFRSLFLIERAKRGDFTNLHEDFAALARKSRIGIAMSVRYNAACAYSWASAKTSGQEREEWARKAVHELTKLRDDKYFDKRTVTHLDADSDIDPIRDRADYKAFRASLGAEVAPPPRAR